MQNEIIFERYTFAPRIKDTNIHFYTGTQKNLSPLFRALGIEKPLTIAPILDNLELDVATIRSASHKLFAKRLSIEYTMVHKLDFDFFFGLKKIPNFRINGEEQFALNLLKKEQTVCFAYQRKQRIYIIYDQVLVPFLIRFFSSIPILSYSRKLSLFESKPFSVSVSHPLFFSGLYKSGHYARIEPIPELTVQTLTEEKGYDLSSYEINGIDSLYFLAKNAKTPRALSIVENVLDQHKKVTTRDFSFFFDSYMSFFQSDIFKHQVEPLLREDVSTDELISFFEYIQLQELDKKEIGMNLNEWSIKLSNRNSKISLLISTLSNKTPINYYLNELFSEEWYFVDNEEPALFFLSALIVPRFKYYKNAAFLEEDKFSQINTISSTLALLS